MMKWILVLAAVAIAAAACRPKKAEAPKVLVLYYSQTSNTKAIAEQFAASMCADMEEIVPLVPYDGTYQETLERCGREREAGILPEVQPVKADIASYDLIFLGYPIWYGTIALPMQSALKQIDLSGKKVVPFCSFGSGGLESGAEELARLQPGAEILPGYGARAARADAVPDEVDYFLKSNGFLEGDFVKLSEFPAPHAVTAEEAAIFDAAISTYPMMQGTQATEAASRSLPNGTEYVFTAAAGRPGPNPGGMKVYVTVENGMDPYFTRVAR